jgi:hypothetical protein|tara:strand:+ start:2004 stop:2255 length:252 start_codon:yes stop_codon:yes gene_type:complete
MRSKRKGGLTQTTQKVYNSNIDNKYNSKYRVISIHNITKHIMIIGVYDCLEAAKLIAEDMSKQDDLKCYVHSDDNRVLHIAGE